MISLFKKVKDFCLNVVEKVRLKVVAVGVVVSASFVALTSGSAEAALDLTGVSVDTAPVGAMALIVIGALAGIWAIWKVIGMIKAR